MSSAAAGSNALLPGEPSGSSRAGPTQCKIVATVGPASDSAATITRLIQSGVAVFRLNFSHGALDEHRRRLATIRAAAAELGQPVAVLGDLPGPKLRVGLIPEPGIVLDSGQNVLFETASTAPRPGAGAGEPARLISEYPALAEDVQPGHRVLINDGAVRLLALEPERDDPPGSLRCRVIVGGKVTSRKGINLPDSDIKADAITARDWECVEWAVANGLDYLALSFVRRAEEVRRLKAALAGMCAADFSVEQTGEGALIPVIAKIEKPQALEELDEIVEVADAIMVARGDLGVEMDIARVPIIQRQLIAKCDEWAKPCIVATQMLESMITAAIPTRAEVSDIASAVLEWADAVMLSAETAAGKYPVLAVETMHRVIATAEEHLAASVDAPSPPARLLRSRCRTAALAHGAWHVVRDCGARLVACWSQEGGTARYLSQTGLPVPIVAYSSSQRQVRRMALLRGVSARYMEAPGSGSLREWNLLLEQDLLNLGWIREGDTIVLVAGKPLGLRGTTSSIAVHTVGDRGTGFMAE